MIILGIDPGTATTGYGVIKIPDNIIGREFEYGIELITYGNISTPKDKLMQDRLHMIHNQMVCEMLFFGANTRTAIAQNGVPFQDYTGLSVKLMVAGSGRSDKKQVQETVRKWLGKNGRKRNQFGKLRGGHLDDATDALAIAICHVLKLASK